MNQLQHAKLCASCKHYKGEKNRSGNSGRYGYCFLYSKETKAPAVPDIYHTDIFTGVLNRTYSIADYREYYSHRHEDMIQEGWEELVKYVNFWRQHKDDIRMVHRENVCSEHTESKPNRSVYTENKTVELWWMK